MEVCIFNEPHRGGTYDSQLRFVQHVEKCGFPGYFRADHYQTMGASDGWPGPTDAWATLAALARETSRVRLGTLVTCATFRQPGPLAVTVAQVDQMSGGRVEFGLGAGWYEREHRSYGIPFPPLAERLDRLAEQLAIITGLWRTPAGERFTYLGTHYRLVDAPALPKPHQGAGLPVIVGGRGLRRTPELAARYADEFNGAFQSVADTARQFEAVVGAAQRAGRAPPRLSVGVVVACGRTAAQVRQREAAMYEKDSALPSEDPVVGSPARLVDRVGMLAEIGVSRVYLRLADVSDLDQLDLIASEALPQLS
jgi:F420-dependent oxidoreductase-like protein